MVSTRNFIIAQVFGLIALVFIVISFQKNNKKKLLNLQILASLSYGIQYLLLSAYSGAIVNIVCIIRNYIFSKYEKKIPLYWLIVILIAMLSISVFTYDGVHSILPALAMGLYSCALYSGKLKAIRIADVITCLILIVYSLRVSALMAFIATLIELFSSLLAIYRYDIKKIRK